ncbi:MAG TPA: acyl-CoA dehydrogenase family protein [Acidimicrobiales bacterium]|jgi:alkylation response protein AidB-like acyl-CoA dehydrogenase|nr:acyl-CoA dehydrogenase family protein [Acidimicrobiales bacterium]
MDLAPSPEQEALVASVRGVLSKHSSPDQVRAAGPRGFDPALWDALGEFGVVAMAVPEAAGGWGAGLLELALIAEQVGAFVAPAPVIETQVAARLLAAIAASASGGSPAADALGRVLAGSTMVTWSPRPVEPEVPSLVPGAAVADAAVLLRGDDLVLLPLDGAVSAVDNLADAPLADVRVGDGAVVLAPGASAHELFERALDEWLVLIAAALVGLAATAHEQTCEYARERIAWGVPIGTYQGVAHPLANDATALDGARILARKAAWELDHGTPRGRELAAMAFGFASETSARVTYDAIHFHGGYGFMVEHDAPLYYTRARGWPRIWGDARKAHQRVSRARYGVGART